ncbi:MAG: hypothetical protein KAZ26_22110 [Caldilineaceae bacterium]|nr:hypothetical protein [Caldilineaceae bacterium]MBP8125358.1 hypothetical protein [Caldilineaceae bacterium]
MTSPLNPNAPSPPDPSANAANSWLDALVDAIADLSPAQRTRLWRRLHVTGLLPSVGPVTDRGRRGVARAVAEETILPSLPPLLSTPTAPSGVQFVPAQPPLPSSNQKPASLPPKTAEPLPHSASVPLTFRSSVSSKVVLGASQPQTEMRPHEMSPLPGQAPESPISLLVEAGSQSYLGMSHGVYTLNWPGRAQQVVRLRFGEQATSLTEAAYDTLIAALESILTRLADSGADPDTARLHLTSDTPALLHQLTGAWPCPDATLRRRRDTAQALLARFGAWRIPGE